MQITVYATYYKKRWKERTPSPPFLLCHAPMNRDGREILLHQQLGQSDTTLHCFHKDDHLKQNQKVEKGGETKKLNLFVLKNLNKKHKQLWSKFQPYLIELKNIKKVKKLPVFLAVLQLAVILLQTM